MSNLTSVKTFPMIKGFRDYHDIPAYGRILQELFSKEMIAYEELECLNGQYYGLFYVPSQGRPSKEEIDNDLVWE